MINAKPDWRRFIADSNRPPQGGHVSSSPVFRVATAADVPAILNLWTRTTRPSSTDNEAALQRALAFEGAVVMVAMEDEILVGTLIGGWDGWRGNVYRLAVEPSHRRRGIAARLLESVESELRLRGASRMTSLVFHEEPGAVEYWLGSGYERDESVHRYSKNFTESG